jgi:hypothetical protein
MLSVLFSVYWDGFYYATALDVLLGCAALDVLLWMCFGCTAFTEYRDLTNILTGYKTFSLLI